MPSHTSPSRRTRLAVVMTTLAVVFGTVGTMVAATATATPAGASGKLVTYSSNTARPGALPNAYGQTTNSDGWAVALSSTQVFNVTHHQPDLEITCHNQSDGSVCWPQNQTKVVTNGSFNYATPVGAGMYLNQTNGHLYTFAVQTNGNAAQDVSGVVCIDTTQPAAAAGSALFCGFTPLSKVGDAPINGLYAGLTSPVQVGTNWYAFNEVSGAGSAAGSGSQNTLLCFSLTTFSACQSGTSQPYSTVPFTGTVTGVFGTAPPIGSAGTDIFIPLNTSSSTAPVQLACFDTSTDAGCTGAWPTTIASLAGSPFPLLNASGTTTGICVPITGNPCFNFTGASVTTPANLASTIGLTNTANGPALVIGSSVYVTNFNTNYVLCYNFATASSCQNFPLHMSNLAELYTVNRDPFRSNCIWVNSDHGGAQIQNFDATTAGACAPGPIRLQASSLIDPNPTCIPQAGSGSTYQSLQITSPPVSSYTSGSVSFATPQGTPVAIPAQPINSFGVVDLSGLNFNNDLLPQFVITLNGLTSTPATVSLRLTWRAGYALSCISEGQTVSSIAGYWMVATDGGIFNYGNAGFYGSTGNLTLNKPIVGIAVSPTRGGYWLVASDGGIFAFGVSQFYGSTGNIRLNKPIVGMAATPDGGGYWLVASDGGIFAFGDAHFYGSAGNLTLNKPIVGMAVTPDGGGYWLVASDGGVFSYGDAQFYGSTGNIKLNKPIVGMTANPSGGGYWMVATDGGIFSFGTAGFAGSAGNLTLNKPIVGMAPTFDGAGYWLAASDGGIFSYGDAGFAGSAGNITLNKPIVGISS